ncbi:uncharacterized protein TNCV_1467451 [Trichonephila clavipes]|uniref:Uncharacterized protein n=1 Tax=Trichonephila clavipes TaxID=2585209 RepID=A0A8X6RYZ2_TRICX|nr:uncharacterized protein TNCV_1467451 [Trichonephila clavipes]
MVAEKALTPFGIRSNWAQMTHSGNYAMLYLDYATLHQFLKSGGGPISLKPMIRFFKWLRDMENVFTRCRRKINRTLDSSDIEFRHVFLVAAVAEWYRYRTVACFVTGSSPVPLKTRRVGQRCTLNLSRAETSSRWCGVVVRRGGASSGVVHVS